MCTKRTSRQIMFGGCIRMVVRRFASSCSLLLLMLSLRLPSGDSFSPSAQLFVNAVHKTKQSQQLPLLFSSVPKNAEPQEQHHSDAVVIGGGPAGLLSAIMYAQKFPNHKVKLYERLRPPLSPSDDEIWENDTNVAKYYLMGLSFRGQKALSKFHAWESVAAVSTAVVGRKDWSPQADGVERIFTNRSYTTQVLPREKLVGCLHRQITSSPYLAERIELNYGKEIEPLDLGSENSNVILRATDCGQSVASNSNGQLLIPSGDETDILCDVENEPTIISTNLLIAADGSARTVANFMESLNADSQKSIWNFVRKDKPFKVTRYVDDNPRVYKTIPMQLPSDWRKDLNYSARTSGSNLNLDALPANRMGKYCAVLLFKKEDPLAIGDCDAPSLRRKLDKCMPQFSNLITDDTLQKVAKKPPSALPSFRYVGPRLHQGRVVLLGDCAHTVKPYFGLGANCALEDVSVLSDALDESPHSVTEALRLFSHKRAGESKALVQLSRQFDRPGKLGFLTFVLPLILDSVFHRLFPKIFAPSALSMLQLEGFNFRGICAKKRLDRALQIIVISSAFVSMGCITFSLIQQLIKALGLRNVMLVSSLTLAFSTMVNLLLQNKASGKNNKMDNAENVLNEGTSKKRGHLQEAV